MIKDISNEVKTAFKKWFDREPTMEELDELVTRVEKNTTDSLQKIEGISDAKINYMYKRSGLFLSYITIIEHLYKSERLFGSDFTEKRESVELMSAVQFCHLIYDLRKIRFSIHLADSPDIILISPDSINDWKKYTGPAILFEVLQIPGDTLIDNSHTKGEFLVNYIKKHKFLKRYGGDTWLLVNVRTHEFIERDFKIASEMLKSDKENPYSRIFITNEPRQNEHILYLVNLIPIFESYTLNIP